MPIIEPCIRPPSEAESILLQVTCGCSSNTCTFCGAYQSKPFRIKPLDEIYADIDYYAAHFAHVNNLFLMDGDALVLDNKKLVPILARIREKMPQIRRIGSYANGYNITSRTAYELAELYAHNVKLIYIGLESGSQEILDLCNKKAAVRQMIDAVRNASLAGIHSSVMVLLGLGGTERSRQHIVDSAAAINEMQPRYLSFLSLMIIPGTDLDKQIKRGGFTPLDARGFIAETYEMLKLLNLKRTQFYANHASNFLPLAGRLPQSQNGMIALCEAALSGKIRLKPEFFGGL